MDERLPILDEIADALEVAFFDAQASSRQPARRRGRRRAVVVAAPAAFACLVVAVLALSGGRPSDLAAKAYAATSGPGVTHWLIEVDSGIGPAAEQVEGWASSAVTHVLRFDRAGGRRRLIIDSRLAGGRARAWSLRGNRYVEGASLVRTTPSLTLTADPFEAFRRAYRERRLRQVGPGRYRLLLDAEDPRGVTVTYELDRGTARPHRLVIASSAQPPPGRERGPRTTVITFLTYEKLPASRAKLDLLPHPGAAPSGAFP